MKSLVNVISDFIVFEVCELSLVEWCHLHSLDWGVAAEPGIGVGSPNSLPKKAMICQD